MRDESGQGVVEFAMVLPFLAALALVFIQFGKAINYWIDLTHVSNEAARFAVVGAPGLPVGATPADFRSAVCGMLETRELNKGSGEVDASTVSVGYPNGPTGTTKDIGDPVTVTVTTNYHWLSFWKVKFDFAATRIEGSATMRLERDARSNPALAAASGACA